MTTQSSGASVTYIDRYSTSAAMQRVLVIDDSEDFGKLVTYFIRQEWPKADVEWYRPATKGKPEKSFPWGEFGLLIIDYEIGLGDQDGFQWLESFIQHPDIPPVLVLSDAGDEAVAVRAIKLGASGYLRKDSLSSKELIRTIYEVLNSEPLVKTGQSGSLGRRAGDRRDETGMTREHLREHLRAQGVLLPEDEEMRSGGDSALPRIPGYKVRSRIGQGGAATVFLAERKEDKVEVVLKVVYTTGRQQDPNILRRFMQEYEVIEEIRHKNVVNIYERAFAKDYAYIAMEYFSGGDLKERIQGAIAPPITLRYLREITEGLAAAHSHGVVHRDLKPGNILFRRDDTLAITDFGIAKVLDQTRSLTRDDSILGTPYYLSPEQVRHGDVDQRSDLYSLGIMLYEMLAGTKPYKGENVAMLVDAHLHDPIPTLTKELSDFQPFIEGLLAKDPDERFQSAEEVLAAIEWMGRS